MLIAVLDSCVLWPSLQRDFLLSLSIEGSYAAVWSSAILAEVERNESAKLVKRGGPERESRVLASRLIRRMRAGFPDAEAEGWESLDGSFGLPDTDDEHVLAAAVVSGAGFIVTANYRDFPRPRVPHAIEIVAPADFIFDAVASDVGAAGRALNEMAERSGKNGRPHRDQNELTRALRVRYGLHAAMDLLDSYQSVLGGVAGDGRAGSV